jgi:hypothetical protein
MNAPDDDDPGSTAVHHRVVTDTDVDATGNRKALVAEAHASGHDSAEALYRAVVWLRDQLPAEAQTQLALCFEWAREGIARQSTGDLSAELKALHAAYTYARDVMMASARRDIKE